MQAHALVLAHGGTVGVVIETVLVVVGLAVLGAAVWIGTRRKVDE